MWLVTGALLFLHGKKKNKKAEVHEEYDPYGGTAPADGEMLESFDDFDAAPSEKREIPEKTCATNGTGMKRKKNIQNYFFISPAPACQARPACSPVT